MRDASGVAARGSSDVAGPSTHQGTSTSRSLGIVSGEYPRQPRLKAMHENVKN
jgi:hypothetical protein